MKKYKEHNQDPEEKVKGDLFYYHNPNIKIISSQMKQELRRAKQRQIFIA
jgi:hypothetical protein